MNETVGVALIGLAVVAGMLALWVLWDLVVDAMSAILKTRQANKETEENIVALEEARLIEQKRAERKRDLKPPRGSVTYSFPEAREIDWEGEDDEAT